MCPPASGEDRRPLTNEQLRAEPLEVGAASRSSVVASDGAIIHPEELAKLLVYNADGTLNYIQVTDGANIYRQTLTYTSGRVSAISEWVKQ